MTDRFAELVRQRALVQEHLAWLDRQIVEAKRNTPEPASAVSAGVSGAPDCSPASVVGETHSPGISSTPDVSAPSTTVTSLSSMPRHIGTNAEEILQQFQVPPDAVRNDVRKGCFLYFAAAFLLLGLGVAVVYFVFRPR